MKKMTSNEIRLMWLTFFKSKEHTYLEPVSLVPFDDPSLLWINSGVATLKPYFDGRKNPPSPRLTNSQKSIRTNDIENVGVTARHQTMFEMLGNFSIGDYFKKEAIHFAWELLTSEKWFGIDKNKLYITVFEEDLDAYNIWVDEIKISKDHIFKGNRDTNFWDVGQGPCGPNTEIFFDRGEMWDPQKIGSDLLKNDIENDRYIEIWNIVFSQFNNDGKNNYAELPRKNIDTGAGLERIVSIFQDTPTNFETDIFFPTIKEIENICDKKFKYSIENYFNENKEQTKINTAFKVIADHIRACTFAIADGVYPGNKDRGYIIRRLIRRSMVYGRKLGIKSEFFYTLVSKVIETMGSFYTYLKDKKNLIEEVIKNEESKFLLTLSKGYDYLEKIMTNSKIISGENSLLLFESFGFPIELTLELAEEKSIKVDVEKFNELFDLKKDLSRESRKQDVAWNKQSEILTNLKVESKFTGYENDTEDSKIVFIFKDEKELKKINNSEAYVILDKTPFYAEKGGQASDNGNLLLDNGSNISVLDVKEGPNHQNIHRVLTSSEIKQGDKVISKINLEKRKLTMKNHSGTHILHSAIREVYGDSAMQTGSFNNELGLRIDITIKNNPTCDEIKKINDICNREIKSKTPCEVIYSTLDDAVKKHNALAFFGDKYNAEVRVVKFGKFSSELCGGTHVKNTSDIEELIITKVESKGSGVFRFSALTSYETVNEFINNEFDRKINELIKLISKFSDFANDKDYIKLNDELNSIKNIKRTKDNLEILKDKEEDFKLNFKEFDKKVSQLLLDKNISKYKELKASKKSGVDWMEIETPDLSNDEMKYLVDFYKSKFDNLVVIVFNKVNKTIITSVSKDISENYKAVDILKNFNNLNVKGGGNNIFAQGKIID